MSNQINEDLTSMIVTDSMLLEWCRTTGLSFDYLESIVRGGYFHDIGELELPKHLAFLQMTHEAQKMKLYD